MSYLKICWENRFLSKRVDLNFLLEKYPPIFLLEKFTGRRLNYNVFLKHKNLKYEARFKNYDIYADFNNSGKYIWICVCHELAHILLKNPPWCQNKNVKKIVKNQKGKISQYKYSFAQAIDQTMAILLQAACENKANIRHLKWPEWKLTFESMGVGEFGKIFWQDWLKYLNNIKQYKTIDDWIAIMLEKNFKK